MFVVSFLMGVDEGEGCAIIDFRPPPPLAAPDMEGSIENSYFSGERKCQF